MGAFINTILRARALCITLVIFANSSYLSGAENSFFGSRGYHVKNSVVVTNHDATLNKLTVILPLAQTNQYQEVINVNTEGGTVLHIPRNDDTYVRWILTSGLPAIGQEKCIGYEFDIIPNSVKFNVDTITTIHPYDTTATAYTWYTGACGDYVDPQDPRIRTVGDSLWSLGGTSIDYCRRCYEYTARSYVFKNPNTCLHPLQEILSNGGGDCGNPSSIFISLARYKKIPARHIVTVRPNGTYHVWADFYLQQHGWIPVDVTYKNSDPSGDYFGTYDGTGIVVTKNVVLRLARDDNDTIVAPLLQTYYWWFWSSGGTAVSAQHSLNSIVAIDRPSVQPHPQRTIAFNQISRTISLYPPVRTGTVSIYDPKGILHYKSNHGGSTIDIGGLSNGMYFLAITGESGTRAYPVIKR